MTTTYPLDDMQPQAITPYYLQALDSGTKWANNGSGVTLSYKFWNALPSYYSSSATEARNFQSSSAAQKTAILKVLDMLESIANVTFSEVTSDSQAQLGFAQASLGSGIGAWAYYPGSSGKSGDVWVNNMYSAIQNPTEGTYGFMALAHEIGHAMGLSHPSGLPSAENSSRYTIMSYNWPLYPESYMLYDIAALQAKYGANMNHATGNDNYALKSGHAYTIWDAGGADTLDGSALSSSLTINLNAGTFSSVGKTDNIAIAYNVTIENAKGGTAADILYGNAADNHIEGNGGNDKLYGGAGDDVLGGGTRIDTVLYAYNIADFLIRLVDSITVTITHALLGFDTLISIEKFTFGSVSFDLSGLQNYTKTTPPVTPPPPPDTSPDPDSDLTLSGTSGSDTLVGGAGDDTIQGNGGYDKLYGDRGNDHIYGGSYIDKLYGGDGNDTLYGYGSYDTLDGGSGNDKLYGGDSTDKIYGGTGNDSLYGDNGNDYLYGGNDSDIIRGGAGTDRLYGNDGNDVLIGGDGNDYLYGDNGNDTLVAGLGRDTLYGRDGSDTFAFDALDSNADYFRDFSVTGSDADRLNITDILSGFDSSDDVSKFVQVNIVSTNQMNLLINQDGSGNDWVTAAVITGSNFTGVTIDSLISGGQLITNDSLL